MIFGLLHRTVAHGENSRKAGQNMKGSQMYADLHLHSTFSDGTNTPLELIELAEDNGIKVIAIADHDTVRGVDEALKLAFYNVRIIPAIEVSTI